MMDRQLIIDNDAFVLLAAAGQLDRSIGLLGFTIGQTRRLPALSHMLTRSLEGKGKAFQKFTEAHRQQAINEASRFTGIEARPADDEISQLLAPAIGFDAPLYATIAESSALWLNSADVAAMRKVCSSTDYDAVKKAMRGRVVSLESLAYRFIDSEGYEEAAAAFSPVAYANKTIKCIFPATPNPADQLESARSYLRSLCNELGRGFLHCPPCVDFHKTGICRISPTP
jgi:hypothetical protein